MTPRVISIVGIQGAGKSTIGKSLAEALRVVGAKAEFLDDEGGSLRAAALLARNDIWAVVVCRSPLQEARERARDEVLAAGSQFFEILIECSVETARRRGAEAGAAYELPLGPDLTVSTETTPPGQTTAAILDRLLVAAESDSPIILLGRGGSGTRLLSQLVQTLGVFIGTDINESDDSLEMVDLVYWLTLETARTPAPPLKFVSIIRQTLGGILRKGKVAPEAVWGWKLPETLYVLPLILEAFPKARMIHLVRHPASVILDRPRHVTANMETQIGRCMLPIAYEEFGRDPLHIGTDPHWLQGAISWVHQVAKTVTWCRNFLPPRQHLQVKFEDLVARASPATGEIAKFIGVRPLGWRAAVDASRLNLPKADHPDLHRLWAICGTLAEELGYRI